MKEHSGEPKNTNSSVYNLLSFDAEFFFTFLLIKSIFTLHVMIDVTKTFFIYVELFCSDPALCVLFVCLFCLFVCLPLYVLFFDVVLILWGNYKLLLYLQYTCNLR